MTDPKEITNTIAHSYIRGIRIDYDGLERYIAALLEAEREQSQANYASLLTEFAQRWERAADALPSDDLQAITYRYVAEECRSLATLIG